MKLKKVTILNQPLKQDQQVKHWPFWNKRTNF